MTHRNNNVRYLTVEGTDVQHWKDDDGVIVIAFGADLDDLARKRVEREILAEYGHRRRRLVPFGFGDLSQSGKRAPAVAGVIIVTAAVSAAAAAVMIPMALNSDAPKQPPAAAGPAHQSPTVAPPRPPPKPSTTRPGTKPPRQPPTSTSTGGPSSTPPPVTESVTEEPVSEDTASTSTLPPLPTVPIVPTPTEIPDVTPPPLRCLKVKVNGKTLLTLLCWPRQDGEVA